MYVHYLLGLGGWVGAPSDEDEAAPAPEGGPPPADFTRPVREPRPGCGFGPPAHRCCRRRAPASRA